RLSAREDDAWSGRLPAPKADRSGLIHRPPNWVSRPSTPPTLPRGSSPRSNGAERMMTMKPLLLVLVASSLLALRGGGAATGGHAARAAGPLRVHPENPLDCTEGSGRAIDLSGSDTRSNLQEQGPTDSQAQFDFEGDMPRDQTPSSRERAEPAKKG